MLEEPGEVVERGVAWNPLRWPAKNVADLLDRAGDHPDERRDKQAAGDDQDGVDNRLSNHAAPVRTTHTLPWDCQPALACDHRHGLLLPAIGLWLSAIRLAT